MTEPIDLKKMRRDADVIFKAGLSAVKPDAAIHRFCRSEGYESGFGLVENRIPDDIAYPACVYR